LRLRLGTRREKLVDADPGGGGTARRLPGARFGGLL
jgi:hypothetical protein